MLPSPVTQSAVTFHCTVLRPRISDHYFTEIISMVATKTKNIPARGVIGQSEFLKQLLYYFILK